MNLNDLFNALWIFLPAGIANATPVIASKIKFLNKLDKPLDFGKSFHGQRIFGDHKTFRGLITGTIMAIITFVIQQSLYQNSSWLQEKLVLDYRTINPFIFGILAAFGALFGDAVKSFFKRRSHIKPGEAWFPFDQVDYIIGGIIFLLPYLSSYQYLFIHIFVVYFLLHIISTIVGYLLKLKDKPI